MLPRRRGRSEAGVSPSRSGTCTPRATPDSRREQVSQLGSGRRRTAGFGQTWPNLTLTYVRAARCHRARAAVAHKGVRRRLRLSEALNFDLAVCVPARAAVMRAIVARPACVRLPNRRDVWPREVAQARRGCGWQLGNVHSTGRWSGAQTRRCCRAGGRPDAQSRKLGCSCCWPRAEAWRRDLYSHVWARAQARQRGGAIRGSRGFVAPSKKGRRVGSSVQGGAQPRSG